MQFDNDSGVSVKMLGRQVIPFHSTGATVLNKVAFCEQGKDYLRVEKTGRLMV
jgi:hypothetical protein